MPFDEGFSYQACPTGWFCGPSWAIKAKKSYPESDESGTFWISTILDMDSRLRAGRGIGKDETEASRKAFQVLQQRGHPDGPPPLISDGWAELTMLSCRVRIGARVFWTRATAHATSTWQRLALLADGQTSR